MIFPARIELNFLRPQNSRRICIVFFAGASIVLALQ
jgi:hypothetical protein